MTTSAVMSWNDLTVLELKKVLAKENIEYAASACRRKSQFVELCQTNLRKSHLQSALHQFGKLTDDSPPAPFVGIPSFWTYRLQILCFRMTRSVCRP